MSTEEVVQLIEMYECILRDCQQDDIIRAEVEYAAKKTVRLLQRELSVRNSEDQSVPAQGEGSEGGESHEN